MRRNLCTFAQVIFLPLKNSSSSCQASLKGDLFWEESPAPAPCGYYSRLSAVPELHMHLCHSIMHTIMYLFHIRKCLTANCEILQEHSLIYLVSQCLGYNKRHNNVCSAKIAWASSSIHSFISDIWNKPAHCHEVSSTDSLGASATMKMRVGTKFSHSKREGIYSLSVARK